jgi:hypothetical protein
MLAGVLLLMTLFFWLQTPEESAVTYIRTFGYFFTAAAFLGFAASVVPLIADYRNRSISRREWLLAGGVVALGAWLIFVHADFDYKFVQREYRNTAVAESLHVERTVEVLSGGRAFGDRFIRIHREASDQAWMYPFLVSLSHDVFGYRELNLFIVNACLGIALLALGYAQGACFGGRSGGGTCSAVMGELAVAELFGLGCGNRSVSSRFIAGGHPTFFSAFKGTECRRRDAAMSRDGIAGLLSGGGGPFSDSGCLCHRCRVVAGKALSPFLGGGVLCAVAFRGVVVAECSA